MNLPAHGPRKAVVGLLAGGPANGAQMSIASSVAQIYVPRLQWEQGVVGFFQKHLGQPLASSALMASRTRDLVAAIERFVKAHSIPVVALRRGQRKDDVMAEHLQHFHQPEGVVFLGKAQEKTPVFRTEKRRNPETGRRYP